MMKRSLMCITLSAGMAVLPLAAEAHGWGHGGGGWHGGGHGYYHGGGGGWGHGGGYYHGGGGGFGFVGDVVAAPFVLAGAALGAAVTVASLPFQAIDYAATPAPAPTYYAQQPAYAYPQPQYAPPQAYGYAPQQYAPAPQAYAPPPQAYAPGPGYYYPQQQNCQRYSDGSTYCR